MKIAIVTLYDYYNYGSFLQAYAMQQYLADKGHEVYFVRTQTVTRRIRRAFPANVSFKSLFDIAKKLLRFQKDFSRIRQIKIDDLHKKGIEAVIIGSDELWNADNDSFNQQPFYYGVGYEDIPTIVYAMSLGNGNRTTLQKKPYAVPAIKNLKRIYARDENTKRTLEEVVGHNIDLVCDPTLLLDRSFYDALPEYKRKKPYILLYSYNMPEFVGEYVKRYAKENHMEICAVCFRNPVADTFINCAPTDFPGIIKNAALVITTTFHGTLFSILYGKKLIVLPYAQKTTDYIEMLSLNQIILSNSADYSAFKKHADDIVDYEAANKYILGLREKSQEVLDSIIH